MKKLTALTTISIGTLTIAVPDFSPIEFIGGVFTIAATSYWLYDLITTRKEKKEAARLNRLEQEAEIAKHKAELEKIQNEKV